MLIVQNANYDPYTAVALVYDQAEHSKITTSFRAQIRPILARHRSPARVLDLGCGTGKLTQLLVQDGCLVIGVDRNKQMLAIARRRGRSSAGARFVRSDLRVFTVTTLCSAAVACGDVVNHFSSLRQLSAFFCTVYGNLGSEAMFVFDSLNQFCFQEYWADRTYHMEGAGGDLVMECEWDECRGVGISRMTGYVRDGSNHFKKVKAVLREYFYSNGDLRRALRKAGFSHIKREAWSPWPDQHLEPQLDRNLWVALKK